MYLTTIKKRLLANKYNNNNKYFISKFKRDTSN